MVSCFGLSQQIVRTKRALASQVEPAGGVDTRHAFHVDVDKGLRLLARLVHVTWVWQNLRLRVYAVGNPPLRADLCLSTQKKLCPRVIERDELKDNLYVPQSRCISVNLRMVASFPSDNM